MANILKPSKLNLLWASSGDILDPGDTKYQTGWGVEVPPRQWENYIQNKQDQAIAHINQHGIAVWDAETEYQADTSYTQGATNGTIYRAKVTHSGQNPELDTLNTYWDIAFAAAGDFYTKAEVDADFLAKDQNFADLDNVVTARTNLNVYSKTETYTKAEVDGKTTIATIAQSQAQNSNSTLLTPTRLADANKGANQQLTVNGFQKHPGGLIDQWATGSGVTSQVTQEIVFPTPFPNACLNVIVSPRSANFSDAQNAWFIVRSFTATSVFVQAQSPTATWTEPLIPDIRAVGY